MFSNDNSKISQNKSDKVANTIIDTSEVITKKEIKEEKKKAIVEDTRFTVRKIAHFTLYFILGILVFLTLNSYGINNRILLFSILLCFIYSISDELHQIFISGRTFKILDILIDTISSSISIILLKFIKKRIIFQ